MGGQMSRIEKPTANVINEVQVIETESMKTYLIIIIVKLAVQLLSTLYQLHKRFLRKSYTRTASLANGLEKI